MTKKLIAILLAVLCTISLFACGKKDKENAGNQATETQQNGISESDEQKAKEVLKEMEAANDLQALVEKYTSVESDETDQDGNLSKRGWEAVDGGYMILIQSVDGSEAVTTPKGNFFLAPDGESGTALNQDPSENETLNDRIFECSEEEEIVEYKEENGTVTILTVQHMDKSSSGFDATYGITDDSFDRYHQYIADSETKELQEFSEYFELSTGRLDAKHQTVTYGSSLTVSDELKALIDAAQ